MPLFGMLYFFCSLDKSNIGNAKVAGMNEDIGLSSAQYSTAVSILYAPYILVMVPSVWVMRYFKKPRYYLSMMIFAWSMATIFSVFIKSYAGLVVTRLLVGLFEGGFFSCISVILTDYYFPAELGRRVGNLFIFSAASSAFGGLIATGISKINTGPLAAWRYIYLIEGLLSFCAMLALLFGLPDSPQDLAKSDEEKEVLASRIKRREFYSKGDHFDLQEVLATWRDPKIYFSVVTQFCQDICLYGFSTFLPTILSKQMHFSSIAAQYLTVPVYIFAGVLFQVASIISDRTRSRGPVIIVLNIISIIGYVLLLSVSKAGVKYFACYLICCSVYTGPGLNEAWIASNTAPKLKRSTAIATNQTFGNLAGVIAGFVYIDPPKYTLGNAFTLGCLCVGTVSASMASIYLRKLNAQHEKIMASGIDDRKHSRKIGDDDPQFKFLV